jgi:hypothetical protein
MGLIERDCGGVVTLGMRAIRLYGGRMENGVVGRLRAFFVGIGCSAPRQTAAPTTGRKKARCLWERNGPEWEHYPPCEASAFLRIVWRYRIPSDFRHRWFGSHQWLYDPHTTDRHPDYRLSQSHL